MICLTCFFKNPSGYCKRTDRMEWIRDKGEDSLGDQGIPDER